MPLDPNDIQSAIRHGLTEYDGKTMGQAWLKPTCVLAIDHLVPRVAHPTDGRRPFLCVNGMDTSRPGAAWDWRRDIQQNEGTYLANMRLYPHECLVDMNLMMGADDPYETLLTAESEGYAGHGQTVGEVLHAGDNDFLWDFYKLLQVPSPVRLMFTLCAERYQGALIRRLGELVNRYALVQGLLDPRSDIWSVSFPTSSMAATDVQVHRWGPGRHTDAPADHSFRAC